MSSNVHMKKETYQMYPVGHVKASGYSFRIEISEQFRNALKHLDSFSHVIVLWWANQCDNEESRTITQTKLPYAENTIAGVFACRTPERPNPIALSICKVLGIEEDTGIVHVDYVDAIDGTPVVDLKPYIPVSERIRKVEVAEWFSDWPEWYEDGAEFFSKNYQLLFED